VATLRRAFHLLKSRSAGDGHDYWEQQIRPGHRRDTAEYYEEHAADLRLLFGNKGSGDTLELCCGSGALYSYLRFDSARYTGVDFSSSMLAEFARAHPELNLHCADVASYIDAKQYDLILMEFSAQHFRLEQLAQVFQNVRRMMRPDSLFVCSTVPWRQARWDFYGQVLSPPYRTERTHLFRAKTKALLGIRDQIGSWFNPDEINRIAAQAGLLPQYYGCHSYPYRFHVVFMPLTAAGQIQLTRG
jgi:SAM-dependent methyltransferase